MTFQISLVTAVKPDRLSKGFKINNHGALEKIGGGQLAVGELERCAFDDIEGLAELLPTLTPGQALLYGVAMHDCCRIVTDAELHDMRIRQELGKDNGGDPVIARTREFLKWPDGSGLLMFDYDPEEGGAPVSDDEFRAAVYRICPAIEKAPHIVSASASSFIYHGDKLLRPAAGWRMLVQVADSRDIERAGAAFFGRCWLNGQGYIAISSAGTYLVRGLVDPTTWQPERLDFVGGAKCWPPLEQRRPAPRCFNAGGDPLDSRAAIPSLSLREQDQKRALLETAKKEKEPVAKAKRAQWIENRVEDAVENLSDEEKPARRVVMQEVFTQAAAGYALLSDFILYPEEGGVVTVGELLANPTKWHQKRFADPLEPEYRGDKRIAVAKLFTAGRPYIYSHAHGRQRFVLHRKRHTVTVVKGERVAAVERALVLLQQNGQHFSRGGELVKVSSSGELFPRRAPEIGLDLDIIARWQRINDKGTPEPIDCPSNIATGVLAHQTAWTAPELDSIATAPLMDPVTGRLIDQDGYDARSKLLLILNDDDPWPGVPADPTMDDVKTALVTLWEPFKTFPFIGDVDRGVMLTALLTTAIRPLLPTAPAFAFDAPIAGSGKTLLAKCISYLAGEETPALFPAAGDEDEVRKRLLAILRMNRRVVVVDNVAEELNSPSLCMMLTNSTFSDRVLGVNETMTLPSCLMFIITGNNIGLRGDLCRRVLTCRIDPGIETPWTRRFDIDPAEYCREHRLELLAAALTVLRAGMAHGAPLKDRTASFETWSDSVRRSVMYVAGLNLLDVGMGDPVDSITTALAGDTETLQLKALLPIWFEEWNATPITVSTLVRDARRKAERTKEPDRDLYDVLSEIALGKDGGINNQRLGKWLERHRERVAGGLRLMAGRQGHRSTRSWIVTEKGA